MSTDIYSQPPLNEIPEATQEITQRAADFAREAAKRATATAAITAQDVSDAVRDAAKHATESAKDMYQSAALQAETTLATSKEYVSRNPVRTILGAIVFGAAIGCLLALTRRKQTFRERIADEPMGAVREALVGVFAPAANRLHEGFDSALDGAGKLGKRVHCYSSSRNGHSVSGQIGRIGKTLKFW